MSTSLETPAEFLDRTASAVHHLFVGIDAYMAILRNARPPALVGSYQNEEERNQALSQWMKQKADDIQKSLDSERAFLAQKIAFASLCGSVLQIAATGIRLYSTNATIPKSFSEVIKPESLAARYCVGRELRDVPLGLIVYAGRNQYNHLDDGELREPNSTIFERLATRHNYGVGIRDPAFDLREDLVWNYASNVTSLIGWRGYDAYEGDMRSMLGV